DGPPREHAAVGEHRESAENDELVRHGIEERTRARGAVAPGQPPVETVARGDQGPQADREPRRAAIADEGQRRDRDEDPRQCERVRGREQRALPEALRRAARLRRGGGRHPPTFASRSGPSAPLTVARTTAPLRANTSLPLSRTTPSISG